MKTCNAAPSFTRLFGAALFALGCAAAWAQPEQTHTHGPSTPTGAMLEPTAPGAAGNEPRPSLAISDRKFIEQAIAVGRDHLAISRVAADRSANADVKRFAQRIVDEQQQASETLAGFAEARGVTLRIAEKKYDRWSRKDERAFDRDYLRQIIADHKEAAQLFRRQAKNGTDAELVDYAQRMLPKVQQNLQEAEELRRSLR